MAPRKQRSMEELYDNDNNARLQQQIDVLTRQIVALATMVQHQPAKQQQALILNPCDVGDFLDVVKDETKIDREVDWDLPPKFDEYLNKVDGVLHYVEDTRDDNGVQIVDYMKMEVQEKIVEAAENEF
ncbi:hypothetical protein RHSIM_Rhsim02G0167300 [Rhododendron simsii]|uniref:Uncharacterized protein n=1 Tax=Rhododendron simsii TaxID=118357 RepID=A0A834HLA8_RHOSS|nr:hypothetical protein RHSIM_Rhsim02G0167300 [Rhododendron simsii]